MQVDMPDHEKHSQTKQALWLGSIALGAASLPLWYIIAMQDSQHEYKDIGVYCSIIPFVLVTLFSAVRR
ncbi:hypothetical protein [Pseudomonas sp. WAC2]|uniref:hypothetical protein n=1 Tax=Pseudomonas sp. WAC2 TaxID=3055057 RepID=UPI0025AF38FA|nr:hypothetical protein [Pseudomonas sp. WAC2]MDN3238073.1 hypothetical protein [Pseudomonas sp. WAC2]